MKGLVSLLQIHPIKGLDPVRVPEARVLASGALEFDRRWALVDSRGRFVNGKNYAAVHEIRSEFDLRTLEVSLSGRAFSLRDGASVAEWMSERLGEPVELRENRESGLPDDTDSPGPTFVSAASQRRVAEWFGLPLDQVRRRFRANIELDGTEPFWEDRLYGSEFRVGEVTVFAVNPCQRCVVPSRDALTGAQDSGFQKRFAELRKAELPASARSAQFNHFYRFAVNTRTAPSEAGKTIRLGDPLDGPLNGA